LLKIFRKQSFNFVSQEINHIEDTIRFLQSYSFAGKSIPKQDLKNFLFRFNPPSHSIINLMSCLSSEADKVEHSIYQWTKSLGDSFILDGLSEDNLEVPNTVDDKIYPGFLDKISMDAQILTLAWNRELLMVIQDCICRSDDPREWCHIFYTEEQSHLGWTPKPENSGDGTGLPNSERITSKLTYHIALKEVLQNRAIYYAEKCQTNKEKFLLDQGAVLLWFRDNI
jgi:hypothetical protein